MVVHAGQGQGQSVVDIVLRIILNRYPLIGVIPCFIIHSFAMDSGFKVRWKASNPSIFGREASPPATIGFSRSQKTFIKDGIAKHTIGDPITVLCVQVFAVDLAASQHRGPDF
jgi:hypothetical protein